MRVLLAPALASILLAPQPAADDRTAAFPEHGLTLTLPALDNPSHVDKAGQVLGVWRGALGASQLTIKLQVHSGRGFVFAEPDEVLGMIASNVLDPRRGGDEVAYKDLGLRAGPYGFASYAALARVDRREPNGTSFASSTYYLCGLLPEAGYSVEVTCRPPLKGEAEAPVLAFLHDGVRYDGEKRVDRWTDDDARGRFERDSLESTHDEFKEIVRTAHYIILTNSHSGKKFGDEMEKCYSRIREIFPFQEVEGRKLMPVFLFKTSDEYYGFCEKVAGWTRDKAAGTKGHAWKDYYATWFEAVQDPVHVHEATHQIFGNRLNLNGGGSWFQEGVAEYVESTRNERNAIATQVKKGRHMKLPEFVEVETLAFAGDDDVKGGNQAGDLYKQAALVIEFLRESKVGKDGFDELVQAMGRLSGRPGRDEIGAVIQRIYGLSLDELDLKLQEYCKKR